MQDAPERVHGKLGLSFRMDDSQATSLGANPGLVTANGVVQFVGQQRGWIMPGVVHFIEVGLAQKWPEATPNAGPSRECEDVSGICPYSRRGFRARVR